MPPGVGLLGRRARPAAVGGPSGTPLGGARSEPPRGPGGRRSGGQPEPARLAARGVGPQPVLRLRRAAAVLRRPFQPPRQPPRAGVGGVLVPPLRRPAPAVYSRRGRLAAASAAAGRREGGGGGVRRHDVRCRVLRRLSGPRPPCPGRGHGVARATGGGGWLVSTEPGGTRRAVLRPPRSLQPTGESARHSYCKPSQVSTWCVRHACDAVGLVSSCFRAVVVMLASCRRRAVGSSSFRVRSAFILVIHPASAALVLLGWWAWVCGHINNIAWSRW